MNNKQDKLLDKELKELELRSAVAKQEEEDMTGAAKQELKELELRLAVAAKQEDRKADLKEGLEKEVKDLQHALALQDDVWRKELKELQQALSLQNDIRRRESRKNIEAMEQISNQIRIMATKLPLVGI